MIQRHILGIQAITSPYKLLAADVNNSRSITASDLVHLRKLILGVANEFENNTSWRFVPNAYTFQDPAFPFDFPSKINLDSIFEDKSNVNFTAVKVGDVNNSAVANAKSNTTESRNAPSLLVADLQEFTSGSVVNFEVRAGDVMDITGSQFELEFDADKLSYAGIISGSLQVKEHHINALQAESGKLYISIDVANGISLKAEEVLMGVKFVAKSKGNTSSIKFAQNEYNAEVYDFETNVRPLHLQLRNGVLTTAQNILYQNQPNPFKDFTNISFELAKESDATIRVMDVTGKIVFSQVGKYNKGYHSLTVSNSQLSGSGVYYYIIEAGEFSATKKMILIE